MKSRKIETIIIGGGISGLSCAKKLHSAGKEFLVITKDIGGRMKASESFVANYGAAYVTEDYHHVLPLVKKGERMRIRDFYYYTGKKFSNLLSLRRVTYYFKILKLIYFSWRIRQHLLKYRKKAPEKSMLECFEEDPFLLKYWLMPAKDFIRKHHLQDINRYVVDPTTSATAFVRYSEVNTVYYLAMIFPVFLKTWIVDFKGTVEKLTKGYQKRIKLGEVNKVKKRRDGKYDVQSSIGHFVAKYVVFAAPQKHLRKVYKLPSMNIQQDAYVFHVQGVRKKPFARKKAVVFSDQYYDVHMLWRQRDGTDIIYTQHGKPDFRRYYDSHTVLDKVHWQPAMVIPTCCILDQEIDENAYIASDFNVSGLEDSYISGLYAANQIIKKSSLKKKTSSQQASKQDPRESSDILPKRKVRDPRCKMLIKPKKILMVSQGDKTYFFCGKSCKAEFEQQIEK